MLLLVWFYFQLGAVGTKTITTGYDSGAGNDGGISMTWYSFSVSFFAFSPSCNLYAFATINNSCLILFVLVLLSLLLSFTCYF